MVIMEDQVWYKMCKKDLVEKYFSLESSIIFDPFRSLQRFLADFLQSLTILAVWKKILMTKF